MFKAGDIQKNIEKLRIELHQIKYPDKLSSEILQSGNPEIYLPIIHYTLFNFSTYVAKFLKENNYDMFAKNDYDFISTGFKALIKLFNYKPILNTDQFFSKGFSEAKVILCSDIIQTIKSKHAELTRKVFSQSSSSNQLQSKKQSTIESKQNNSNSNGMNSGYNFRQGNSSIGTKGKNKQVKGNDAIGNVSNDNYYDDEGDGIQYQQQQQQYAPSSPKFNSAPVNNNSNDDNEDNDEDYEEDISKNLNSNDKNSRNNQQNQVEIFESSQEFPIQKTTFPQMGIGIGMGVNNSHMQNSKGNNNEDMQQSYKSNQHNAIDFSALVQVINTLSGSVTQMANKIENFKINIEDRLNKVEAELSLIKNRQNILENKFLNCSNNSNNNNSNSNLSYPIHNYNSNNNRHDDSSSNTNEQIFSFACDDHSLNVSNKRDSLSLEKDKDKEKIFSNTNPLTFTNTNSKMTHQASSTYNSNLYYTTPPTHNTFTQNNPNIYEDTDRLIENVEKKFKETQRLLSEFN